MKKTEAGVQACIDFLRAAAHGWEHYGVPDGALSMRVAAKELEDHRDEILDEAAKLRLRRPKW